MSDDFVTYKQFYEMILEINKQRSMEVDSLRSLIIATSASAEQGDLLRHTSLRGSIKEIENKLDTKIEEMEDKIDDHKKEDNLVEKRVTKIEESEKRIAWIIGLGLPSMLAAWETLKVKLNLK